MKKTGIILLTVLVLVGLLTGCASTKKATKNGYTLSRADASAVALADIGIQKDKAVYTVVSESENTTAPCYDVEISVDGVVYRYRVDAAKGDILKISVNNQPVSFEDVPKSESSPDASYIGLLAAKEIAYADAGISENEIVVFEYKMDYALGVYLYDLEFDTATHEYEYEISATDGAIFKKDVDGKTVVTPDASQNETYIGVEAAEDASLAHAGKDRDRTVFEVTKWKMKKGVAVYDVEFVSDGVEYEYTINATTGAVISHKSEGSLSSGTTAYIGEESAKAIALAHAGLTADTVVFESVEPDVKKGKTVYEIEFRSNGWEYEYEIDAETGDIIDAEKDRD